MRNLLIFNLAVLGACSGADLVNVEPEDRNGQTLNEAAVAYVKNHPERLGLVHGDSVRQRMHFADRQGRQHTRFERSYRGLPVRGGDFIIHQDQQGTQGLLAEEFTAPLAAPLAIDTSPTLTAEQASAAAVHAFPHRKASEEKPQLVIYAIEGEENVTLAYEVVIKGATRDGTPSILHSFVDAHKGNVLGSYDEIETMRGTGYGLYAGRVPLSITDNGNNYQLIDGARGDSETLDADGSSIASYRATFGNGETDDPASVAVDAHYGAAVTWDYYRTVHGRDGIADDGKGATSIVHYGNDFNNAFWNTDCFCMTYGDGDGSHLKPLAALDVAGHEMSHGVNAYTAGLVYTGESGGLNESNSDIFGTAIEFFAKNPNQPGNYLIGEHVAGPSLGQSFLRSMKSPRADGGSIDHYSLYRRGMDVHYSSGIANNFFYLLAEGGRNATSGKSVTGIGRSKAEEIWYRALTVYFTPSTNFKKARTATLSAARDLYDYGSDEEKAVAAAWTAVGVN